MYSISEERRVGGSEGFRTSNPGDRNWIRLTLPVGDVETGRHIALICSHG